MFEQNVCKTITQNAQGWGSDRQVPGPLPETGLPCMDSVIIVIIIPSYT